MKLVQSSIECPRCHYQLNKPDWRCPNCFFEFEPSDQERQILTDGTESSADSPLMVSSAESLQNSKDPWICTKCNALVDKPIVKKKPDGKEQITCVKGHSLEKPKNILQMLGLGILIGFIGWEFLYLVMPSQPNAFAFMVSLAGFNTFRSIIFGYCVGLPLEIMTLASIIIAIRILFKKNPARRLFAGNLGLAIGLWLGYFAMIGLNFWIRKL
jgi:hypothetical protein